MMIRVMYDIIHTQQPRDQEYMGRDLQDPTTSNNKQIK
jgi:hypothetical protein